MYIGIIIILELVSRLLRDLQRKIKCKNLLKEKWNFERDLKKGSTELNTLAELID